MFIRKHAEVARVDLLPQRSAEKFSLTLQKESSRSGAVTCFMDGRRRAVDVVYLDFSKAVDEAQRNQMGAFFTV